MYVWLDALTNYITALDWHEGAEAFDNTGQLICIWWARIFALSHSLLACFLMAAELPLPKRVFAHGWWTNEGEKISKSLEIIDPIRLVEEYGWIRHATF